MKNTIVLFVLLAFISIKVEAQTFTVTENLIMVDSFANSLVPNHKMTGDPRKSRIVYYNDKHERPKWIISASDSLINFQYYSYDAVGNIIENTQGSCYLRNDAHWYLICPAIDIPAWKKDIERLRKLLGR